MAFEELDDQSFLLANDLGVWDQMVTKRLPKSKFLKLEEDSLKEIAKYSPMPGCQTNITMRFNEREEKAKIPIEGKDAILPFYAIFRPKKKNVFDYIGLFK